MLFLNYLIESIQSSPFTSLLSFLAFLVSILSVWNSSRALQISQKNSLESKLLASSEKRTRLLGTLQDANIFSTHSKMEIDLAESTLNHLLKFPGEKPSEEILAEFNKTIMLLDELKANLKISEERIKERFSTIKSMEMTVKPLDFEAYFADVEAFKSQAHARLVRAENMNADLNRYKDILWNKLLTQK